MSHELRTPLNAIIGFSEMMRTECSGRWAARATREYAATSTTAATHLLAIINDILDLAKIEAGKL